MFSIKSFIQHCYSSCFVLQCLCGSVVTVIDLWQPNSTPHTCCICSPITAFTSCNVCMQTPTNDRGFICIWSAPIKFGSHHIGEINTDSNDDVIKCQPFITIKNFEIFVLLDGFRSKSMIQSFPFPFVSWVMCLRRLIVHTLKLTVNTNQSILQPIRCW